LWERFVVGVNYWPRRRAMLWWKEFDESEVKSEFKEIRDLGLQVVRIFLIWEDFQPEPSRVSQTSLSNLEAVLDIAASYGLRVVPTLLVGFMSGLNWVPEWAIDFANLHPTYPTISSGRVSRYSVRDIYEDEAMLEAEKLLFRTVVSRFRDHPAVLAWDISNEIDNLRIPRTREAARRWLREVVEEIRRADPHHPVVLGMHQENLEFDKGFYVQDVAETCDLLCMHGYPAFAPWGEGPLDSKVVPFLNVLAENLGGRKVLFEEFGIATSPPGEPTKEFCEVEVYGKRVKLVTVEEGEAAKYYLEVLEGLHRVGSLGALAWMFSDYDPVVYEKLPPGSLSRFEGLLGLTRADGSVKPIGLAVKRFSSQGRRVLRATIDLGVSGEEYYANPMENLRRAYERFKREFSRIVPTP